MSRVDLAELRRLHEAATKGDWYDSSDGFVDVAVSKTRARQVARAEKAKDAQYIAAAHNALPAILDELEAAREMTAFAETYGELVQLAPKVAGAVVGHEWDNMRPVEQKRWLLAELSAARETICRLSQANADLRKERDRAVAEAQRQDGMAKGLRKELRQLFEQQHHMKLIGAAEELERLAGEFQLLGFSGGIISNVDVKERAAQLRREAESTKEDNCGRND